MTNLLSGSQNLQTSGELMVMLKGGYIKNPRIFHCPSQGGTAGWYSTHTTGYPADTGYCYFDTAT